MEADSSSLREHPIKLLFFVAAFLALAFFVYAIRGILAPFALAFVLAYILAPLVDRMEGRGLNRTLSIILIFILTLVAMALGIVAAGQKLVDEMVDLSQQFLLPESTTRRLTLGNRASEPVVFTAEVAGAEDSFVLEEPQEMPFELAPGEKQVLSLRFVPLDTTFVAARLKVESPALSAPLEIGLRGNAPAQEKGEADRAPARPEEFFYEILIPSSSELDFGRAGPNIVTRMSAMARREIQPKIQRFVGEQFNLATWIEENGGKLIQLLLGRTTDLLEGVFSGITFVVIVPFVTFFFLKEGHHLTRELIKLVPNAYFELCLNLIYQINAQIGGYIRGQILAVSVVAILAATGLLLIEMPYALPIGLLAGLANMIPYLGPLIGIVSASIVALAAQGGLDMVSHVVLVFLVVQLTDNILIQPTVVARSVDLHPLVVLLVVMVGSQWMGIVGMLIAVPLTGILKVSGQVVYQGIKGYRLG